MSDRPSIDDEDDEDDFQNEEPTSPREQKIQRYMVMFFYGLLILVFVGTASFPIVILVTQYLQAADMSKMNSTSE